MTRKRSSRTGQTRTDLGLAFDPLFASLVFAGIGLGTLALGASPRLALLWTALLGLWLVYRAGKPLQIRYELIEIGRGALIGLGLGAPLALIALRALVTAIPILFVSVSKTTLEGVGSTTIFVSLVLLAPLAEELFFRDIVQRAYGIWLGVGLYAAAGLILFLPTAGQYPVVLLAVVGAWSVLGIIYSFLFERFGLATALASHVTINLFLLFVPALLNRLGLLTS